MQKLSVTVFCNETAKKLIRKISKLIQRKIKIKLENLHLITFNC